DQPGQPPGRRAAARRPRDPAPAAPPRREAQRAAAAALRPQRPAVPVLRRPDADQPRPDLARALAVPEVRRADGQRGPLRAGVAAGGVGRPAGAWMNEERRPPNEEKLPCTAIPSVRWGSPCPTAPPARSTPPSAPCRRPRSTTTATWSAPAAPPRSTPASAA